MRKKNSTLVVLRLWCLFWLQYLEWPLEKLPRHDVASLVSGSYHASVALTWFSDGSATVGL